MIFIDPEFACEFKESGVYANQSIHPQTFFLAFEKVLSTGDKYKDFIKTKIGKYVKMSRFPNMKTCRMANKYYYYTTKNVEKGEELTITP